MGGTEESGYKLTRYKQITIQSMDNQSVVQERWDILYFPRGT
jgi:hypothetical protein